MQIVRAKVDPLMGLCYRTHVVQSILIFSTLIATLCVKSAWWKWEKYREAWIFYLDSGVQLSYREQRMFQLLKMKYSIKYIHWWPAWTLKLLKFLCLNTSVSKSLTDLSWVLQAILAVVPAARTAARFWLEAGGSKVPRDLPWERDIWTLVCHSTSLIKSWVFCESELPDTKWLVPTFIKSSCFFPGIKVSTRQSVQTCSFVQQPTAPWVTIDDSL